MLTGGRRKEEAQICRTPYFVFPENPKIIEVGGHKVYEYLSPQTIELIIRDLAEQINFLNYKAVLVNMNGGIFLYNKLAEFKGYTGKFTEIEYNRPENSVGTIVTIPVPAELEGEKCIVIDDIADRGTTLNMILKKLSTESLSVALITKRGIENQETVHNIIIGTEIDPV